MTGETSSAARKRPSLDIPVKATIYAVVLVATIRTLLSTLVLHLIVLLVAEAGRVPDIGWAMLFLGVPRLFIGCLPWSVAFVLIFWVGRKTFLDRWVFYGMLWSLIPLLGLPLVLFTNRPGFWARPVFETTLGVVGYLLSAYLTKVVFSRGSERKGAHSE